MSNKLDPILAERQRIQAEYQRREQEIETELYAHWQPSELFIRSGRKRTAAMMLHKAGVFPKTGDQCLEIGYGSLGWLGDLITWGVRETDIHGIELDPNRAKTAQSILPQADLRVGDATKLPWEKNSFRLVIVSTVFTSILDEQVRSILASEITRVLMPSGALLWYDFAFNNPSNTNVRKVGRSELAALFPDLEGEIKSVTLAPPVTRFVAPKSWTLASILEAIPLLRTHLLAVLIKKSS